MRESPLIKVMESGRLVACDISQQTAADPAPTEFELEVVRLFNENKKLKSQNRILEQKNKAHRELREALIKKIDSQKAALLGVEGKGSK